MRFKLEVAFPDDEDKSFLHINLLDEQDEIVYTIRTVYQSVKTVILKRSTSFPRLLSPLTLTFVVRGHPPSSDQLVRTIEWETNKIIKLGSHGQGVEATTTETELEFSHGRHIVENDEFKYWWSTAMRQHLPKVILNLLSAETLFFYP